MVNLNGQDDVPGAGKLLISEPFLHDSNFKRSVVLLCEYGEQGSVGFILNRPLGVGLKDVLEDEIYIDIPLYLGGPVQKDTLHFIHTEEANLPDSRPLGNGIYWGTDFEEVMNRIREGKLDARQFRFFLGYAGWGQEQLNDELEANSWIVASASKHTVFELDEDAMWKGILKNMGGSYKVLSNSPESPFLN